MRIEKITDIRIDKNKRNYRPQHKHLEYARRIQAFKIEMGESVRPKGKGQPSKKPQVQEWRRLNPNGTKAECMRALGFSKATIYKHWDNIDL